jgi:alkanesulfonate monooxygenase
MTTEVLFRVPVDGDGRTLQAEQWHRGDYSPQRSRPHRYARTGLQRDGYNYHDYLSQVARGAELAGFDGLWIPQTEAGEEPLVVAGALARVTRRIRLVASLRAPLISAVYAAKIAVSFQRLSGGRLAWHWAVEDEGASPAWHGRAWSITEQIARTGELLDVARGFWSEPSFTYEGRYYDVEKGGFAAALQGESFPRVFLSDGPPEAIALGARHADTYVLPLGRVDAVRARIDEVRARASERGRTVQFALEASIIARHTRDDAWAELQRRWREAHQKPVAVSGDAAQTGTQRSFEDLRLGENLWGGFALNQAGPSVGLVGGYRDLAAVFATYAEAGVSTYVLSAHPHLEEAYGLGEHLLPLLGGRASDPVRVAV